MVITRIKANLKFLPGLLREAGKPPLPEELFSLGS